MIILDENIIGGERDILKRWKSSIRQIGFDIARKGLEDVEVIPFLLRLPQPTFLTRDNDFFPLASVPQKLRWFGSMSRQSSLQNTLVVFFSMSDSRQK